MEQFRHYLITRLVAVLLTVVASELLLGAVLGITLVPLAAHFAGGDAAVSARDLPMLLMSLLFGTGQVYLLGAASRSLALLLVLTGLLIFMVPIVTGILVYARLIEHRVDILTREREAEHTAYEARRNLMFSDFAHDLRTPIMTINGYAGALADGMVTGEEQQREYLSAIRTKSARMAELITMLFDYVRLGSEGYALSREKTDLHELLLETAAAQYSEIENASMELLCDIPEEPFLIFADRPQLMRAFENILLNAVRHNGPGTRILLRTEQKAGTEYVIVADSGSAIEKDCRELFQPFVKEDASRGQGTGSGLGLSIVREILDLHGYAIGLRQPYENYTKAFIIKVNGA